LFLRCRRVQSQELKWHTNVKEAIAIGNKEHKPLMMFLRVVIGGWCIRLQKEVLLTPDLQNGQECYSC
jgi:protein disulfide-isomerase